MPPIQVKDDPVVAQKRRLLNAAVQGGYPQLCAVAGAMILKRHRGMKSPQMIDLVQEVVQEAIMRALGKADEFDSSRRAIPWLSQFIMNVLKESARQHKRQPRQSDFSEAAWDELIASLYRDASSDARSEQLLRLADALGKLRADHQNILLLRYKDGLDGEGLAHAIGAPTCVAARVRLHRAKAALREAYSGSADQEEVNP